MKILIEIRGGVVQLVVSEPGVELYMVDWDNIWEGDEPGILEPDHLVKNVEKWAKKKIWPRVHSIHSIIRR